MIERTIGAAVHGRYLVVGSALPAEGLLVGFHGYAEAAEAALERMQAIPNAGKWVMVAIQGLHRFYRGRSRDVVASWMTRQDRELAIADNLAYVGAVVDEVAGESPADKPLVFTAFSQGVAMAYRAACASRRRVSGVISLGGDVPPELDGSSLSRIPAALLGRGSHDEWYTDEKLGADVARLTAAGVAVTAVTIDAAHDWTPAFADAAAGFLKTIRS